MDTPYVGVQRAVRECACREAQSTAKHESQPKYSFQRSQIPLKSEFSRIKA